MQQHHYCCCCCCCCRKQPTDAVPCKVTCHHPTNRCQHATNVCCADTAAADGSTHSASSRHGHNKQRQQAEPPHTEALHLSRPAIIPSLLHLTSQWGKELQQGRSQPTASVLATDVHAPSTSDNQQKESGKCLRQPVQLTTPLHPSTLLHTEVTPALQRASTITTS